MVPSLPEALSRRARRSRAFVWAFGPHVVLGSYLAFVPDHALFTATQVAVVVHVLLALVTLPVLALWFAGHVRAGFGARSVGVPGRPRVTRAARIALTVAALAAVATGLRLLPAGDGMPAAAWHRWAGLLAVGPFLAHLAVERGRAQAMALARLLAAMAVALTVARLVLPAPTGAPETPAFAVRVRANAGYDPAAWCGECHTAVYAEWSRSTHARSLQIPSVRADFTETQGRVPLRDYDSDLAHARLDQSQPCVHCHMPTSFYGDDAAPVLRAPAPTRDGVTCSFCHTLRGVNDARGRPDAPTRQAFYVSAPETVRRYLGQGARQPWLRALGNRLIRWRPEMHRRDYHVPFLDTANACVGCHGINPATTYADWERSAYATGDPGTETRCQDCHMARAMTTGPVREPGRLVPWGPVRPQRRSHFFLGGNVQAPAQLNDRSLARREHAFAEGALRITVAEATLRGARLRVAGRVFNDRIGHSFPGMESSQRLAWVEVRLRDAGGWVTWASPQPGLDGATPRRDGASPVLYRDPPRPGQDPVDTTVPARGSQGYETDLPLPAGFAAPVSVVVVVRNTFDPQPLAQAERAVVRSPSGD